MDAELISKLIPLFDNAVQFNQANIENGVNIECVRKATTPRHAESTFLFFRSHSAEREFLQNDKQRSQKQTVKSRAGNVKKKKTRESLDR